MTSQDAAACHPAETQHPSRLPSRASWRMPRHDAPLEHARMLLKHCRAEHRGLPVLLTYDMSARAILTNGELKVPLLVLLIP
jgi:hypothetical protein